MYATHHEDASESVADDISFDAASHRRWATSHFSRLVRGGDRSEEVVVEGEGAKDDLCHRRSYKYW